LAGEFVLTGVDQTIVISKAELKEYFSRMFETPDSLLTSIKIQPTASILTRFLSDNVGICYGTSTDTYTLKKGGDAVMNSKWTATLIKENGEWRIAAVHAGADILNNPILNKSISLGYTFAAIGAVGGFALGLLLMIIVRRRKR
jgi:hypothetical protein